MYLYNSATHKKEEFKTHTPNHVEMYTCGPTVYHFAHIGNLRSYIMEDVLEKYLRFLGYSVNRVMNITDVGHLTSDADEGEDKMVKGAKREHKTVMEIAQYYTDAFFADCRKLNIKRPDVVQPATGLIDDYIKIITKLLDTGYAYLAGGNVYFDTSKLERYYIFNDHNEEDLAVGVREGVEEDENKKNKNDFVLWFTKSKFEDQALKWDSPWGVGYPGWHIECSGISMKYNGEYLDLHCGGVDNAFPHHTNEIAQSESYLGHPWCLQWCHVAHLNTSHGKMSKSKGEFLTVSLLEEKGYDPLAYRFFCLQSHYRKSLVFTWENLDNAVAAYNMLPVYEEPWVAVIPKGHPLYAEENEPVKPAELLPYDLLIPSRESRKGEIDKWFEGTGHAPVIRGRIAHMMNAYELSLHGVGISIYPASISSLIRDKDVCVREVEHPDAHASYALIWNKNHTLSHVAEEFIAYVKEESGQQMYYA